MKLISCGADTHEEVNASDSHLHIFLVFEISMEIRALKCHTDNVSRFVKTL